MSSYIIKIEEGGEEGESQVGDGKVIPIRWIGEQHVKEDLGRIPNAADWLTCIRPEKWMNSLPD